MLGCRHVPNTPAIYVTQHEAERGALLCVVTGITPCNSLEARPQQRVRVGRRDSYFPVKNREGVTVQQSKCGGFKEDQGYNNTHSAKVGSVAAAAAATLLAIP